MFLVDWLYGILVSLGLWQKKAEIIFLGLDNAGKTMLLYSLKNDSMLKANPEKTVLLHAWNDKHRPTRHPRSKQLKIGKIKFTVFDLGGHEIVRRIFWKVYYAKMDAIVYLVDAHDKERFAESKKELDALLSDESLAAVPFLILGNKIDIPFAASEKELRFHLGLTDNTTGKGKVKLANSSVRPIEVFMCSVAYGMGYDEGFQWLSQYIKQRKRRNGSVWYREAFVGCFLFFSFFFFFFFCMSWCLLMLD